MLLKKKLLLIDSGYLGDELFRAHDIETAQFPQAF